MSNLIKILGLTIVILSSLFIVSCKKGTSDADGQVLARVGSHDIKESDVDISIKQQLGSSSGLLNSEELISARLNVLNSLVQTEVLFVKAEKENLVPDDAKINEETQKRIKDSKLTKEDFERQLKDAGITEAQWRDQVRKELAITALVDKHVKNAPTEQLTDAEISKYYDDHRSEFVAVRGVDVSVIVTDPRNNNARDDAIGEAQAEQKIKDIYAQLRAGSDFGTVASQRSEHNSAMRNGNIGFASEEDLKQTFPTLTNLFQQLMAMRPGEYTPPMKEAAAGAWLIFKLNDKREQARNLTLDDASVRQAIIDAVNQARQQVLQNALLVVATTETEIKNYLAERVLGNPKIIGGMRPSALLQQGSQPQQPQPRFENQNQSAPAPSNSNRASSSNANTGSAPGGPARANANR